MYLRKAPVFLSMTVALGSSRPVGVSCGCRYRSTTSHRYRSRSPDHQSRHRRGERCQPRLPLGNWLLHWKWNLDLRPHGPEYLQRHGYRYARHSEGRPVFVERRNWNPSGHDNRYEISGDNREQRYWWYRSLRGCQRPDNDLRQHLCLDRRVHRNPDDRRLLGRKYQLSCSLASLLFSSRLRGVTTGFTHSR